MTKDEKQKTMDSIPGLRAFLNDPNLTHIEKCDPAEVLGQIGAGKEIAPTCPDCKQPMKKEGNIFFCSCQRKG